MILIFDTETTGLPKNYNAAESDFDNWPRVVQLAWSMYSDGGELILKNNFLVKPEGFEIPAEATKIHGITQEKALAEGKSLSEVLGLFTQQLKKTSIDLPSDQRLTLVAHNFDFDKKILGAEMIRLYNWNYLNNYNYYCTMKESVDVCKVPSAKGFKYPKLMELYTFLFQEEFKGAHDALNDVEACAKCYFELKRRGYIK